MLMMEQCVTFFVWSSTLSVESRVRVRMFENRAVVCSQLEHVYKFLCVFLSCITLILYTDNQSQILKMKPQF